MYVSYNVSVQSLENLLVHFIRLEINQINYLITFLKSSKKKKIQANSREKITPFKGKKNWVTIEFFFFWKFFET